MNPVATTLEQAPKRRGRLQLLMLLMIVIGPVLLANAMYKWGFWVPEGRTYHGELIGDGTQLSELGVNRDGQGRWQIVVTDSGSCAAACQRLVYLARQIQISLNRETGRASHVLAAGEPLAGSYTEQLRREYPQLQRLELDLQRYQQVRVNTPDAALWLVDPHGNVVLRYDAASEGKAILDDLRYLLKISVIG